MDTLYDATWTVPPKVIAVWVIWRSKLEPTPQEPVTSTVELSDLRITWYPAVPVATATPTEMTFAAADTMPALATAFWNAVALRLQVTSKVPVTEPLRLGWAPVYILRNPPLASAVQVLTMASTPTS